ncbi:non-ribosomal peptide synthetase, partial [Streptomyces sp. AK02-01A]|nr:non-ribosomal peptide synthetase [Streptomyces sp. AK02-01A]
MRAAEPDALLLVTDRPRSLNSGEASGITLALPQDLAERVRESRLALAAFAVVLHRYTGQSELPLDADLSGGGDGGLTLTVDPDEPIAALLAKADRAVADRPAAGTAVRFADHRTEARTVPGDLPDPAAEIALTVDGGTLHLGYRSSLFERETVERFGAHLLRAMRFLAGHPHRPVR